MSFGRVKQSYQAWLKPPHGLSPRLRWLYSAATVAYPAAMSVHLFFIGLYLWLGSSFMAIANVMSILIWALGLLLLRRLHFSTGLMIVYAEVILHSVLTVKFLGMQFGIQFYLVPMMAGMFLIPFRKRYQLLFVALLGSTFILLTQWDPVPILQAPALLLDLAYSLNLLIGPFGLTALISMLYIHLAEQAEIALEEEHVRSEKLLHSILPESISHRLKSAETIADRLESASILFADLVDFSGISRSMTPSALLTLLNNIFSDLDDLVDHYGLEKIKTIGDAYMVASGVPVPCSDHAIKLADFALAMRELLKRKSLELGIPLQMRIGMHSGSVVAGVIGHKRFQYDLWGETVNTASRMESHGIPSEIQISEETANFLEPHFDLTLRGVVDIKGKGPTVTWLLLGRKSQLRP